VPDGRAGFNSLCNSCAGQGEPTRGSNLTTLPLPVDCVQPNQRVPKCEPAADCRFVLSGPAQLLCSAGPHHPDQTWSHTTQQDGAIGGPPAGYSRLLGRYDTSKRRGTRGFGTFDGTVTTPRWPARLDDWRTRGGRPSRPADNVAEKPLTVGARSDPVLDRFSDAVRRPHRVSCRCRRGQPCPFALIVAGRFCDRPAAPSRGTGCPQSLLARDFFAQIRAPLLCCCSRWCASRWISLSATALSGTILGAAVSSPRRCVLRFQGTRLKNSSPRSCVDPASRFSQ